MCFVLTAGNDQMKVENFSAAVEFYSKAIAINPQNAVYYCNRSVCFSVKPVWLSRWRLVDLKKKKRAYLRLLPSVICVLLWNDSNLQAKRGELLSETAFVLLEWSCLTPELTSHKFTLTRYIWKEPVAAS